MDKEIDVRLDSVVVIFPAGTHISQCIREAVAFSALENCEVRWNHNEINIIVDARTLVEETYTRYLSKVPK